MAHIFTRNRNENVNMMDTDKPDVSGRVRRAALGDITNASNEPSGSNSSNDLDKKNDRPYMNRDSDDIDERDSQNPLLCTDVVEQMYQYFSESERATRIDSTYMGNQRYINERMRTILVDWLVSSYDFLIICKNYFIVKCDCYF